MSMHPRLPGSSSASERPHNGTYTTRELADALGLKEQSIIKRRSKTGSYFGIVAGKYANGRLCWPADSIERLRKGEPQ